MVGRLAGKNRVTELNGRPDWWSPVTCLVGNCLCPKGSRGPRSTATAGAFHQESYQHVNSQEHPAGH